MSFPATFNEGRLEVEGVAVRYREAGSGGPVVVLDGWPWRFPALQEALAGSYRVLEIEIPGGVAADTAGPSDLSHITGRAVSSLVEGPYTLIGTSVGASAALWQTLVYPDAVSTLVLISPLALRPAVNGYSGIDAAFAHPQAVEFAGAGYRRGESALSLIRSASHDDGLESRLGEIPCPTLAVFGQEDRLVAAEAPRIYREKIPNCNISFVYDAGHVIAAERPEALTSLVADFIQRRETFIVERGSGIINP